MKKNIAVVLVLVAALITFVWFLGGGNTAERRSGMVPEPLHAPEPMFLEVTSASNWVVPEPVHAPEPLSL